MSDWIIPVFIAAVIIYGFIKKTPVFEEFTRGAGENLRVGIDI